MKNTTPDIETKIIRGEFERHIKTIERTLVYTNIISNIKVVTSEIIKCFNQKTMGRVFIFGNGGSAADAQHIAAEFTNRFTIERKPLPMIALTTDTSALTAISNDYSFNDIYSKQLQALARKGDVVIGISTSGNSENVLKAFEISKLIGCHNVLMTGQYVKSDKDKNKRLISLCDTFLNVDSKVTARIQECHIIIGHIICKMIDNAVNDNEINLNSIPELGNNFKGIIINKKSMYEFEGFNSNDI